MKQKRHSVDQIISKLRKADVELGMGKKVSERRPCRVLDQPRLLREMDNWLGNGRGSGPIGSISYWSSEIARFPSNPD